MADSLEERARRWASEQLDVVANPSITGTTARAFAAGYRAAVEDAARVAEKSDGYIPSYRDSERDGDQAEGYSQACDQIAIEIRALAAPSRPTPGDEQRQPREE